MRKLITNHLRELEVESVFVIREVAAQFENAVILFREQGRLFRLFNGV